MRILPAIRRIFLHAKEAVSYSRSSAATLDRREFCLRTSSLIFVSLIQACSPLKITEVEYPPTVPPVENDSPSTDMQSALAAIFSNHPSAAAFGEIHKSDNPGDFTPTNTRFAEEILPLLPSFGIKDLVVEFLPDDPAADAELAIFSLRGSLGADTPILNQWVSGTEAYGKLKTLETARENGITILGGSMNLAECPDPNKILEMFEEDPSTVSNLVRDHIMRRMEQVLSEGRAVASYVGIRHNNYAPASWDAEASFGDELFAQSGVRYVEVDLVVPELIEGHESQIGLEEPQNYIPASGVTLVDQAPRYLIFFPGSI